MAPMREDGLAKLVEECGELVQVIGKLIGYPDLRYGFAPHPDGTVLRERLAEEIGDVLAGISFVTARLGLNEATIEDRKKYKLERFEKWDSERHEYCLYCSKCDLSSTYTGELKYEVLICPRCSATCRVVADNSAPRAVYNVVDK